MQVAARLAGNGAAYFVTDTSQ